MNIKVRLRNPVFWVQLIGAMVLPVMAYFNLTAEDFTTWPMVWEVFCRAIANPYVVVTMIWAAWNALIDPTTVGWGDSKRAMGYEKPFKEEA